MSRVPESGDYIVLKDRPSVFPSPPRKTGKRNKWLKDGQTSMCLSLCEVPLVNSASCVMCSI